MFLFYQNFGSLFIVSQRAIFQMYFIVLTGYCMYDKQEDMILFQHQNCIITWYVITWQMVLEFKCKARKFQATYVRHLWQIQWNMDFTSLDSTFSLILRTFLSVPTDFHKKNLIYSLNSLLFFLLSSLILHSNWT